MSTKLFLIASSLLMAMSCVNASNLYKFSSSKRVISSENNIKSANYKYKKLRKKTDINIEKYDDRNNNINIEKYDGRNNNINTEKYDGRNNNINTEKIYKTPLEQDLGNMAKAVFRSQNKNFDKNDIDQFVNNFKLLVAHNTTSKRLSCNFKVLYNNCTDEMVKLFFDELFKKKLSGRELRIIDNYLNNSSAILKYIENTLMSNQDIYKFHESIEKQKIDQLVQELVYALYNIKDSLSSLKIKGDLLNIIKKTKPMNIKNEILEYIKEECEINLSYKEQNPDYKGQIISIMNIVNRINMLLSDRYVIENNMEEIKYDDNFILNLKYNNNMGNNRNNEYSKTKYRLEKLKNRNFNPNNENYVDTDYNKFGMNNKNQFNVFESKYNRNNELRNEDMNCYNGEVYNGKYQARDIYDDTKNNGLSEEELEEKINRLSKDDIIKLSMENKRFFKKALQMNKHRWFNKYGKIQVNRQEARDLAEKFPDVLKEIYNNKKK